MDDLVAAAADLEDVVVLDDALVALVGLVAVVHIVFLEDCLHHHCDCDCDWVAVVAVALVGHYVDDVVGPVALGDSAAATCRCLFPSVVVVAAVVGHESWRFVIESSKKVQWMILQAQWRPKGEGQSPAVLRPRARRD